MRCYEPCAPGSTCRVPHPTSLRQDCGSMFGAGVAGCMHNNWSCGACGERYTTVTDVRTSKVTAAYYSYRFCFETAIAAGCSCSPATNIHKRPR